ncbi:MAG TPA: TonB-dependent receptor [Patescibacteria group bacterium]|nr:TonB-dependent receptor [Patescibacteria group bacterium]
MRKRKKMRAAVGLAILACLATSPVWAAAETTGQDYNLETVYVIGKGDKENEAQKKISINVKDKIDAGQINSITDLLRDIAGFTVQSSPQAGTQVTMRGLSNDRFLVMINGNVLENQGGLMRGRGLEWDMIPLNNVKKIEITRGASSALYGGSWGGVVNIITQEEPGKTETDLKFSYGSYETKKASLTNRGSSDSGRFSWTLNANKQESDGFYKNNWSDGKDLSINFNYKMSDTQRLAFAWTHIERKEGTIVGNIPGTKGYDPDYPTVPVAPTYGKPASPWIEGSYRFWRGNNYSLNYTDGATSVNLFQNTQFRDEWVRTALISTLSKSWESNLDTSGIGWQRIWEHGDHKTIYGMQYKKMDYDLISSQSDLQTKQIGVFIQDNWQWRPNVTVGLGLRFDQHKLDMAVYDTSLAQKPRSDTTNWLSPKLSVTRKISEKESVYSSVSGVFRPPTASDYYRWSGNYFDWSVGSNPRLGAAALGFTTQAQWQQAMGVLEPEHGVSYELGWKKQATDRFGWRITAYYNDIDNYINTYSPPGSKGYPPTYNIGNAKIKGIEVSTDYVLSKRMTLVSSYTNQVGSKSGDNMDPGGTSLTSIPRHTFNTGLRYQDGKNFRAALDVRYLSGKVSSGETLGGYVITDLGFSWQYKNNTISLAVNNLFNKDYQETAGYPMPGTTYSLSWQTSF